MSNIERFFHLLRTANSLIGHYGPHTTFSGTTVFTRAPVPRPSTTVPLPEEVALSLAAAQDSINSAQPKGPSNDDLLLFTHLWETTITLLEQLLETEDLDQESFAWGIFGLASGYMHPPASTLAPCNLVSQHKNRLHAALTSLPSMDSSARNRNEYMVSESTKIRVLVKARKEIHLCANLLLLQFREEDWRRVRWWHTIAVAERWIGRLGLGPADMARRAEDGLLGKMLDEQKSEEASCGQDGI